MKLKLGTLFISFCISSNISAQDLKINTLLPSVVIRQDSAVMTFRMTVSANEMDTKHSITLTPMVKSSMQMREFSEILLNGEKIHRTYKRRIALNKRKSKDKHERSNDIRAYKFTGEEQQIEYCASIKAEDWMQFGEIVLKREDRDENGTTIKSEILSIPNQKITTSLYQATDNIDISKQYDVTDNTAMPVAVDTDTNNNVSTPNSNISIYKGSFLPPDIDATDERNKKELKFDLEEARVMVDINPRILSLRELFTVAISYKDNKEMFYKIIDISVKSYPADPIANLNAASAAIERGNIHEAGRYLQMATRDTLAYKNCRGVYELLTSNIYEGIRLLKAAKAEGSEEAAYNLEQFFKSKSDK